jgi:hypothetical protein
MADLSSKNQGFVSTVFSDYIKNVYLTGLTDSQNI